MSRIAVVTSSPPFSEGGHLVIARSLVEALREAGHEADLVTTPQNRFGRQASAYLATWLTDVGLDALGRPIDQIITLRFPSYAARHPRHVCWLNHTMREYYDLWPRLVAGLGRKGRLKEAVRRRLIHAADRYLLSRNVTRLFVQSETIRRRLEAIGPLDATVLYPPPPPRPYRCDGYGDFILAVSRLTPLKRFDLLIRALAEPEAAGVRLVIAGDGEQRAELEALARAMSVERRVRFVGRVDGPALVEHLARCAAVAFVPFQEDYGFVTVEAFAAAKAVVTCRDSGGPAELVRDGLHGFVTDPEPAAVARALGALAGDRLLAERMGQAARAVVENMSWQAVVSRLVLS
ncbi:MAG TPA: glycosyltransferase family 4 protein [Vicinamibacterales bacterium]|nr:glycosyltransferase family 4 protein [Vicinamibacterales bacterium]